MIKYHAQFLLDKEKDRPNKKEWVYCFFNISYRIEVDKWSKETQHGKINYF